MATKALKIWLAKDEDGLIFPYSSKPFRQHNYWCGKAIEITNEHIGDELMYQLKWEGEPVEAYLIIKSKED